MHLLWANLFTIKHAAAATGVPEATLRTWERRYGVVAPERSEGGYRTYDPTALARLSAMRGLVDAGWSPARAAAASATATCRSTERSACVGSSTTPTPRATS